MRRSSLALVAILIASPVAHAADHEDLFHTMPAPSDEADDALPHERHAPFSDEDTATPAPAPNVGTTLVAAEAPDL